ncbi:MAG: MtnX-like HAD-IB family phosphatase [Bacteroidetes bacterium]|nr:MtnX-like HAD-IB family phosphatase [Bacteroidota bacterium]
MNPKNSTASSLVVFCDFDGTIAQNDIGDALFRHFGVFEPYHSQLLAGEITVREYYQTAIASAQDFTPETIKHFTKNFSIDAYFPKFYQFCLQKNIQLTILSDGFIEYIHPMLEAVGVTDANVRSNYLSVQNSGVQPIFPGASESCKCFCASCKRNTMLSSSATDSVFIYIGDGLSDTCAASHADIIFAKHKLAAFCNERRIPHYPFHTFFDILRIMEKIVDSPRTKIRRQAELQRKKSIEIE